MIHENNTLETNKEKAEFFADKLKNTFSDSDDYCQTFNKEKFETINTWVSNYLENDTNQEIPMITIQEISTAIKKTNTKTSYDINQLNNKLIKNSSITIQFLLKELFNKCIQYNKLPMIYKKSQVTMIPKKGDATNPKNYRPISVTSCLIRLFEKIIQQRLENILNDNDLITKYQSGFRNNRQTKDNLIFLSQKTIEGFNNHQKTCAIFYGIASAMIEYGSMDLSTKCTK